MSTLLAAVLSTGAPGVPQFSAGLNVGMSREPVPSWAISSVISAYTPADRPASVTAGADAVSVSF